MLAPLQYGFDALERRRRDLLADLAALTPNALAFRPALNAWSLADVAQHLQLVEARTTRVLTERRVSGVTRRRLRDTLIFSPALDLYFRVGLKAKMPVKGVAPEPGITLAETAARWAGTRSALASYLDAMDDAATRAIVYRHPIAGYMNIVETLRFLARHHDHHLRQVARITRAARGTVAGSVR